MDDCAHTYETLLVSLQLFQGIVLMLATQGWQKILDEQVDVIDEADKTQEPTRSENPLDAIDNLVECFRVRLERAATEASEICGEFAVMFSYTSRFILEYQSVRWQLFHVECS